MAHVGEEEEEEEEGKDKEEEREKKEKKNDLTCIRQQPVQQPATACTCRRRRGRSLDMLQTTACQATSTGLHTKQKLC